MLPTGPINLANALPAAASRKPGSDDESGSDEERWRGKTGDHRSRSGKTGIRNGFATSRRDGGDDDDY